MKKIVSIVLTFVSLVCGVFPLVGCGEKKLDNRLPYKEALVSIDCSDIKSKKARLSIANETENFDVSGVELFNKTNNKRIKSLVGGDQLEIYYTDENYQNIDHILVQEAKVLALEVEVGEIPGAPIGHRDIYSNSPDIVINHTKYEVYWVIDKFGNFIALSDFCDATKLYGTYIEEEVVDTGIMNNKRYYIHALYTYDPS